MPTFAAPDGAELAYDALEAPRPRTAVLFLHGWSDHAGRWTALGEGLRDAGYSAYLADLRGHGRSGGRRGHLSRFSQLLGDLQAFRRAVRRRANAPQVLFGHSFGGLVVARYLETLPSDPVAAAVLESPFLGVGFHVPLAKRLLGRVLADLWPSVGIPTGLDPAALSRDPAVAEAYRRDPLVHHVMTPGAWREIQWAQRAVPADAHTIDVPTLFLLGGDDHIVDVELARAFAGQLRSAVTVRWYPEMFHEPLHDPRAASVLGDVLAFLAGVVPA